jgi:hypothetical protein
MNWKGFKGSDLVLILRHHSGILSVGTEENHEETQDDQCPSRDAILYLSNATQALSVQLTFYCRDSLLWLGRELLKQIEVE